MMNSAADLIVNSMVEAREEQRKFEQAMRSLGIPNERLKRPLQPWLYFDPEIGLAWEVWQLARKEKS